MWFAPASWWPCRAGAAACQQRVFTLSKPIHCKSATYQVPVDNAHFIVSGVVGIVVQQPVEVVEREIRFFLRHRCCVPLSREGGKRTKTSKGEGRDGSMDSDGVKGQDEVIEQRDKDCHCHFALAYSLTEEQ